jgi:hypothetical protein
MMDRRLFLQATAGAIIQLSGRCPAVLFTTF